MLFNTGLYQSLTKTFFNINSEPENPKVLLLVPTAVPSINIDDTTIHRAFQIPAGYFGKTNF